MSEEKRRGRVTWSQPPCKSARPPGFSHILRCRCCLSPASDSSTKLELHFVFYQRILKKTRQTTTQCPAYICREKIHLFTNNWNKSSCVTKQDKYQRSGGRSAQSNVLLTYFIFFNKTKMKTKFINGVSSSPSMSLGLLVTENALQVQPDTEEDCKELVCLDHPDLDTRRKAYLWCREFLHGAWKSLSEDDFSITIIRYTVFLCTFHGNFHRISLGLWLGWF